MLLEKTGSGPTVGTLKTKKQWRSERGAHLFPSDSSLDWFIRKYRERLMREGAYVVRGGRAEALCTERMDTVVAEILIGEGNI